MVKLLAAWGTYVLPEILCIKGKKCHKVMEEKGRMIQHDSLQEKESWASYHCGHKQQAEGQSHIFPFSHTPTHCSALVRTNGLIQLPEINLT